MRRFYAATFLLVALCSTSSAGVSPHPSFQPPQTKDPKQEYIAFLHETRIRTKLPALAVGIANRDGTLLVAVDGTRDVTRDDPVSPTDEWHIGSITKPMTATLAARLVEKGLIRWDTKPIQLWPELAASTDPAYASITLEMLLRHRAGIPAMEEDADIAKVPSFPGDARRQREAFVQWALKKRPAFPVGSHHYSNAGYGIAAAMLEKAAGESWEDLMRREVFAGLGMRHCGFGWPALSGHQPRGHRFLNGKYVPHDLRDGYGLTAFIAPAGDVHCAVSDMLTFGRAHLLGPEGKNAFLRPETWRKLHDAPEGDYALGWNVRNWGFHHLGSAGTFDASLLGSPQRNIVVFIAANGAGEPESVATITAVAQKAFNLFALPKKRP